MHPMMNCFQHGKITIRNYTHHAINLGLIISSSGSLRTNWSDMTSWINYLKAICGKVGGPDNLTYNNLKYRGNMFDEDIK